jgi:hypothetical protein
VSKKQIHCHAHENVFQAFARAKKSGELPAVAKLFPMKQGVPEPEAPAGYITIGTVLIRPREAFAVGVPAASAPSIEVGEENATIPLPSGNTPP